MQRFMKWTILSGFMLVCVAGCESKTAKKQGDSGDTAADSGATANSDSGTSGGGQKQEVPELPPGHPPIGNPPSGHAFEEESEDPRAGRLTFTAPEGWASLEPRNSMIQEAYTLPRQKEDTEDATVEVTHFPGMKDIPFSDQVERWEASFEVPEGQPESDFKKQATVPEGVHTIHLLDISGTYKNVGMMGRSQGEPKENYRMLAAQIDGPTGPSFVKAIGPKDTLSHWEDSIMRFLKTAE